MSGNRDMHMTDNKEHIARGMLRYAIQGLQDNPEVLLSDKLEVALDEVLNEHLAAAVALVEALACTLNTAATPTLPPMTEVKRDPASEDTGTEVPPIPPGGDRQADVFSEGRDSRMAVTGDQEMATEARTAASEAAEPEQATESPPASEEIAETAESPTPGERKRPQDNGVETAVEAAPSPPTSGTLGPSSPTKLDTRPGAIPPAPAKRVAPPLPRTSFKTEANAKVGEVYDAGIQTTSVSGAKVEIVECQVPPEIGITYDSESGRLRGTPSAAGEYTLPIRYRFAGIERAILEGTAALVVIADPRTLWKDLSSSRDAPDWKPDEASLSTEAAYGLQIAAASKRGRSHAHVGAFRDDDFWVEVNPEGPWNILAVADGAGSAPRSRRGSRIASQQAVWSVKEALTGALGQEIETAAARWIQSQEDRRALDLALYDVLGGAAFGTVKAIEEAATSAGYPAKDYATTLLLAVHRKSEFGHLVASYWLGDGAIGLYSQERGVELLGWPDGGEFAGQTRFLDRSMVSSGQAIMDRIHVTVVDEFTALLLMTDGVSDPKFGADTHLSDRTRWDQLWEEIEPLLNKDDKTGQRLLEWLDFWSVGDHDDRTIAVLW
jgi:hypothetical protein